MNSNKQTRCDSRAEYYLPNVILKIVQKVIALITNVYVPIGIKVIYKSMKINLFYS